MNETYLKLLAEHIKEVRKVEKRLVKDFEFNGGDVSTLDDDTKPCPPGYERNDKGECVPNEG